MSTPFTTGTRAWPLGISNTDTVERLLVHPPAIRYYNEFEIN